jgi:hypothetical protein
MSWGRRSLQVYLIHPLDAAPEQPFVGWPAAFDPLLTAGGRNHWKTHDFTTFSDAAASIIVEAARRFPSDECDLFIAHLGGQVRPIARDATAFSHRDVEFLINVHTRWREPAQDKAWIAWARALFSALTPHAGSVCVNFVPEDEVDHAPGAYGANYDGLLAVKKR